MIWRSARPVASLSLVILAFAIAGCGSPVLSEVEGDGQTSREERAQSIDKSLICPVCPGETIDQAQVELAQQMRAIVRERLADGWSREQILQFFVDRYGESVLASPPKEGFNLAVWVVPPATVAGAVILLTLVIRAMRRGRETGQGESHPAEQELEPYLSLVDRELGIPHSAGSEQAQDGSQEPDKPGVKNG